jgi:hypothetical protein
MKGSIVLVYFGFLMGGSEQCLHNLFSIENIFLFIEIVDEIIQILDKAVDTPYTL